jgi:hypothetical protein
MPIETRSEGRELMVQFTCRRCKNKALMPYDTVMTGEHYNYLHNSSLPPGWDKIGYSTIVCETCAKAYEMFMNPTKTEE